MTRDEALQRLKALGLRGEVGQGMTSPERRAEARARYEQAQADALDLKRRIDEQFGAERQAITRRHDQALADMQAYRFRIYRQDGSFYMEVAKADTWETAFAQLPKATPKKQTA